MMKSLFQKPKENAVSVVLGLLNKLNIKVSQSSVKDTLKSHPEYPSLLSISDSLTQWKVPHEAYQLEPHQLTKDLFPIVVHFRTEGGKFVLLKNVDEAHFYYEDETGKSQGIEKKTFYQQWSGTVLLSEADEQSGESNYKEIRTKEVLQALKPFILITTILFLVFLFLFHHPIAPSLFFYPLLLCKGIGLFVSILLLIQSLDAQNPFVKNLCSLSKKSDCNAILKSNAAHITSWLSWSEVGFAYFSFTFIILLINTYTDVPEINVVIGCLSLLCIPYSIYSIYYQSQIAKQWCVLCLVIQTLFWVESITVLNTLPFQRVEFSFDTDYLFIFLLGILPTLFWSFGKPYFKHALALPGFKQQLKQFKYNAVLFDSVLKMQPHFAVTDDLLPIRLGNPAASIVITMVSNPFCDPCAKAHATLDEWLEQRDDIRIEIILTGAAVDKESMTKVTRHLLALSEHPEQEYIAQTLNSWYAFKYKKYDQWEMRDAVEVDEDKTSAALKRQAEWCDHAQIAFTPTILINGYKLPEQYKLEDIQYLI